MHSQFMGRFTPAQRALIEKAGESKAQLEREGFAQVCSTVAGPDSCSDWLHPDGRYAIVAVRTGNQIEYFPRNPRSA